MLVEQKENNVLWSPSKIITRLGEKINNADSIYYWAAKNHIPVFSPALTDGSLGDMIFFHSFKNPGLIIDIASGKLYQNDYISIFSCIYTNKKHGCSIAYASNGRKHYCELIKIGKMCVKNILQNIYI